MAENKEIVLVNKSKGKYTINFQGVFQDKRTVKDGKFYLTEKEMDFVKAHYPHILEGETKRLYLESELEDAALNEESNEKFFAQKPAKIKAAIAKMEEEEAEAKLHYAQLKEVSETIVKALEDRILELDKVKE